MISMADPLARLVAAGQADCGKALHSFTTLDEINTFRRVLSECNAMTADLMALIRDRQDQIRRSGA